MTELITEFHNRIRQTQLTIYDRIDPANNALYASTSLLEQMLHSELVGKSLTDLPLRTRSKVVKTWVCEALGYPVPKVFRRTQPRFPCQNFDVYVQKSLNVQIWNEEVDAARRYVFIHLNQEDMITAVKIIIGSELAKYDRTGTLTTKYQALLKSRDNDYCSETDTENVLEFLENSNLSESSETTQRCNSNLAPQTKDLLSITHLYELLQPLVGKEICAISATQERNRGVLLHKLVCEQLGYKQCEDDGSYPDLKNQLLEVKLQTSSTIDLGLHSPEAQELILTSGEYNFYSEDVRYAIFQAQKQGDVIRLQRLYLVTGAEFTQLFPIVQGKGTNRKIQILLPSNFFSN